MFADWTRGEILNLITVAFSALGTFANAATVRWVFLRRVLRGSALLISILVALVLGWLVRREENTMLTKPPIERRPPVEKPTPLPTPPPVPRDFQAVPDDPDATKDQYCVVADFKGSLVSNADSIDVTITEGDVDLCRFSKYDWRRIAIRVGVSSNGSRRVVAWSSRTVIAQLEPGESFSLNAPLRLSIRKRMYDLSRTVVFVEVENRPWGTGPRNRYRLTSPMDQVAAN